MRATRARVPDAGAYAYTHNTAYTQEDILCVYTRCVRVCVRPFLSVSGVS